MAEVRVFNYERMKELEDKAVVSAYIEEAADSARNLILVTNNGTLINVGNVGGTGGVVVVPPDGDQSGILTSHFQEVV
jgi:hypothetical protein